MMFLAPPSCSVHPRGNHQLVLCARKEGDLEGEISLLRKAREKAAPENTKDLLMMTEYGILLAAQCGSGAKLKEEWKRGKCVT